MARGAVCAPWNRSNPAAIHSFHKPVHSYTGNWALFSAHRVTSPPEPVDNNGAARWLDQHPGHSPSEVPRPANSPPTPATRRVTRRARDPRSGSPLKVPAESRRGPCPHGGPHGCLTDFPAAVTLKPPSPEGYDRGHQRAVTQFTALDEQSGRCHDISIVRLRLRPGVALEFVCVRVESVLHTRRGPRGCHRAGATGCARADRLVLIRCLAGSGPAGSAVVQHCCCRMTSCREYAVVVGRP